MLLEKHKGLHLLMCLLYLACELTKNSVCCQSCKPSKAQNSHQVTFGVSSCSSVIFWRVERTDLEDNEKILSMFYRFL